MSRRVLNMVTAGLVVVGFGYLIAVAARSLPGQENEGRAVDIDFSMPAGAQNAIVWILMGAAGLGALLLLLAVRRGRPEGRMSLRSLYTAALWIVLVLIIFRYAQPMMEEGGAALSELEDPAAIGDPARDPTLTVASWIVSLVVAAAVAAALVRVAVVARTGDWRLEKTELEPITQLRTVSPAAPVARMEGDSPQARVINAYADFEDDSAAIGQGRVVSETARHHAARVEDELGLIHSDVDVLSSGFEAARYGEAGTDEAAADRVESAWSRLRERLRR